jgi:hypothetical protein
MNEILEALEREPLSVLKTLLSSAQGRPFQNLIRQKYLEGEDPQPDKELSPDSQESQEAVVVEERRLDNGAWVWGKLNPEERQSLLKATEAIYGPNQGEELELSLTMRLY